MNKITLYDINYFGCLCVCIRFLVVVGCSKMDTFIWSAEYSFYLKCLLWRNKIEWRLKVTIEMVNVTKGGSVWLWCLFDGSDSMWRGRERQRQRLIVRQRDRETERDQMGKQINEAWVSFCNYSICPLSCRRIWCWWTMKEKCVE